MPFTSEQFLSVFQSYNTSVFPLQIVFNLAALICIYLLLRNYRIASKVINGTLAFLWLWIGVVYHIMFFSSINKAAYLFGIIFIIQALMFFFAGIRKDNIEYKIRTDWIGAIGWVLIIYSLLIYPVLGYSFGHGYPRQPTFGLPCPTTIFTFGIILFSTGKVKWYYLILPLLWSFLGVTAAINLGILEDIGLLAAGLISFSLIIFSGRQLKSANH